MSWTAWGTIIIFVLSIFYAALVFSKLFQPNGDYTDEELEQMDRQRQIDNGVVKNDVKDGDHNDSSSDDNGLCSKFDGESG